MGTFGEDSQNTCQARGKQGGVLSRWFRSGLGLAGEAEASRKA